MDIRGQESILSAPGSGFFDFQDIARKVIQRFAKTRSHTKCEKGFGNSQHASASEDFMDGDALLAK